MTQAWHNFLALPLVVHIIAWAVLGLAAIFALIKGRVLAGAWNASGRMFWSWVSRHVSSNPKPTTRFDLRMVAGSLIYANWSIGTAVGKEPVMILMCQMHFAHVENVNAILKRGYLEGTIDVFPMTEIEVEGPYEDPAPVCVLVKPIKAKTGKNLTGRFVFIDQFNGKHVSEKITFQPNTIPPDLRAKRLIDCPNCFICNQPVEFSEQAPEAQITAHIKCIWP